MESGRKEKLQDIFLSYLKRRYDLGLPLNAGSVGWENGRMCGLGKHLYGNWENAINEFCKTFSIEPKQEILDIRQEVLNANLFGYLKERYDNNLPLNSASVRKDHPLLAKWGSISHKGWRNVINEFSKRYGLGLDYDNIKKSLKKKRKYEDPSIVLFDYLFDRYEKELPLNPASVQKDNSRYFALGVETYGSWRKTIEEFSNKHNLGLDYDNIKIKTRFDNIPATDGEFNNKLFAYLKDRLDRGLPLNPASVQRDNCSIYSESRRRYGSWKSAIEKFSEEFGLEIDYGKIKTRTEKSEHEILSRLRKLILKDISLLSHKNLKKDPEFIKLYDSVCYRFGWWQGIKRALEELPLEERIGKLVEFYKLRASEEVLELIWEETKPALKHKYLQNSYWNPDSIEELCNDCYIHLEDIIKSYEDGNFISYISAYLKATKPKHVHARFNTISLNEPAFKGNKKYTKLDFLEGSPDLTVEKLHIEDLLEGLREHLTESQFDYLEDLIQATGHGILNLDLENCDYSNIKRNLVEIMKRFPRGITGRIEDIHIGEQGELVMRTNYRIELGQIKKIREGHKKGWSSTKIAEYAGVCPATVIKYFKKLGLSPNFEPHKKLSDEQVQKILATSPSETSACALAKETGISHKSVLKVWRKAGYDVPQKELSAETIQKIHKAREMGMNCYKAAEFAGVSATSVCRHWRKRKKERG